jgi:hypothetical protein
MVAFNDRRESIGSGDFNNPSGTFSLTTHGYDQEDRWAGMSHKDAAPEVRSYYSGQKDTKTWQEANRLAARRTAHEVRRQGYTNGFEYASAYQDHLARVMATKGPSLAEKHGELKHRQSGYGRT